MNEEAERNITCYKDPDRIQDYLYNHNIVAFIVIVIAIITAEFWFEFFHQILREITGQTEPSWFYMLLTAAFWTFVLVIVSLLIFKIPFAASFTL